VTGGGATRPTTHATDLALQHAGHVLGLVVGEAVRPLHGLDGVTGAGHSVRGGQVSQDTGTRTLDALERVGLPGPGHGSAVTGLQIAATGRGVVAAAALGGHRQGSRTDSVDAGGTLGERLPLGLQRVPLGEQIVSAGGVGVERLGPLTDLGQFALDRGLPRQDLSQSSRGGGLPLW